MAAKVNIALRRQGAHGEVGRVPVAVRSATASLVGSRARPLELGRFLLSSTGFHLILAWAVISLGIPKAQLAPRPLVVTLIESASPEPSASSGHPVRARTSPQPALGQVAPPANLKAMAQPRIASPPPLPPPHPEGTRGEGKGGGARPSPASSPARATEVVEPTTLDERIGGPKAVGMPDNGSRAVGAGAPGAFVSGGSSSGPALLGLDGGAEASFGPASRGGAHRLDAALVAPLAPTVTVGYPRDAAGGGASWGGNRAAGGRFSAPNYGTNPLPKYPPLAREKGYEGTVYLRVLVRADGRVGKLAIDRSSGYEILDRVAVDSVQEWTFLPAQNGGKPVESWVLLPVKFALN